MENLRQVRARLVEAQPVREVVAEVVAAERLHRHRVTAHDTDRTGRGGRRFGGHRGTDQHTVGPVARLEHERHQRFAATAEDDRRDRHAACLFSLRRPARTAFGRHREARIRMRRGAIAGDVVVALPVLDRNAGIETFPPRLLVLGQRDIGEDGFAIQHRQGIGIGLGTGAGRDAEEARLWIDRPQASVFAGRHPADVVAHGPHLPAGLAITLGRNQHGQIGLAAGRGECGGDVVHFALRVLDADDQHVFGQPAFAARLPGTDAQRMALLAEQGVAAVAGADRLDRQLLGEMHDEATRRIQIASRMQALDELALALDARERGAAHARHQPHVGDDVGRVGDLDATTRDRRVDRSHAIRDHVQRAALHATLEQRVDLGMGLSRRHPVVVRSGVVLVPGANEGQVLDAGDIGGTGAVQVAIGMGVRVQRQQIAGVEHQLGQLLQFGGAAIAPVNALRLRQRSHLLDPVVQGRELGRHGHCSVPDRARKGKLGEARRLSVDTQERKAMRAILGCKCELFALQSPIDPILSEAHP